MLTIQIERHKSKSEKKIALKTSVISNADKHHESITSVKFSKITDKISIMKKRDKPTGVTPSSGLQCQGVQSGQVCSIHKNH